MGLLSSAMFSLFLITSFTPENDHCTACFDFLNFVLFLKYFTFSGDEVSSTLREEPVLSLTSHLYVEGREFKYSSDVFHNDNQIKFLSPYNLGQKTVNIYCNIFHTLEVCLLQKGKYPRTVRASTLILQKFGRPFRAILLLKFIR